MGSISGNSYLLDVFRKKADYPELKRSVIEQMKKHSPCIVLIEDKASGTQLIQDLKADGVLRVRPYEAPPQTDKIMRFDARPRLFEGGKVFLPTLGTLACGVRPRNNRISWYEIRRSGRIDHPGA